MPELTGEETVQTVDRVLHDVGTVWMIHRRPRPRAVEYGYEKAAGRSTSRAGAGCSGTSTPSVVIAAFGWWQPGLVRHMWGRGLAVASAREGARRYAQACAAGRTTT